MDTAYSLPFDIKINNTQVTTFTQNEHLIYGTGFSSAQIFENDDVDIYFNSNDPDAKLYLDALDIVPDGYGVVYDDDGQPYRHTCVKPLPLFQNNGEYDALRVDSFRMVVIANKQTYYGLLDVLPKQLSADEWTIMRNDLESEISGLAQDIVRRNIGLGTNQAGILPPEKLYAFYVIHKYSKSIMGALTDLKDKAKYHIIKEYRVEPDDKAMNIDAETVKRYLRKGLSSATLSVPYKTITYDIQENRLLKHIIQTYENELDDFIQLTEEIKKYYQNSNDDNQQYQILFLQGIDEFHNTAIKLRKVTGIIKTQQWYQEIGPDTTGFVPHSFALDSRYGTMYKMYQELRHPKWNIKLDPNYAYSWKKSSSLYEMWCYIRICRSMLLRYSLSSSFFQINFDEQVLFPFLNNGTTMSFENEKVKINVIFDQFVPKKLDETDFEKHPFYTISKKNRPDITIDAYSKITHNYIGSIILECKYRKLSSYWFNPLKDTMRKASASSRPQILSYYNDTRSRFYRYNVRNGHPIDHVIVLTPDVAADSSKNYECGAGVINKALRPAPDNCYLNEVMEMVFSDIDFLYEDEKEFTENLLIH